jgi:hypothetical protein
MSLRHGGISKQAQIIEEGGGGNPNLEKRISKRPKSIGKYVQIYWYLKEC